MKFFLRHFLPITYFQVTRLNRWALVGYNGLVEWIPALGLSYYYNDFRAGILWTVVLSYLAFICIYEIGYFTNDFYSERFEKGPRGRAEKLNVGQFVIWSLIIVRIAFFILFSYLLGVMDNRVWWAFHGALAVTFAMHNILPNELRIPTFFGLSTFRYFAPVILTLGAPVLIILIPTILLNNSLYRSTVYLGNKNIFAAENRHGLIFKMAFYLGCLPLSVFLSIFFGSYLPIMVCLYFIAIWLFYFSLSKVSGRDLQANN